MLNNNQGKQMLIDKYINDVTATELLSYKLVLSSQIIENEKSIDLIDAQIKKMGQFAKIKKPKHDFKFPFAGKL